jgi:hypothetical protein
MHIISITVTNNIFDFVCIVVKTQKPPFLHLPLDEEQVAYAFAIRHSSSYREGGTVM